jgi:DNA-directed RNA polymerase specialized sigma24 family protein
MSVDTDSPPTAGAAPCPCRRGDVAAEVARQRPLLERAARGDREAFARLFLMQVDGVYRYLLAWTGERAAAKDLTEQVFRAALAWLPVTVGAGAPQAGASEAGAGAPRAGGPQADADLGAWLVALARDAVTQRREAGWMAGPEQPGDGRPPPADALEAAARLGDPEREVVVLRLLLGHSLAHTAELTGYSLRAVSELQLAACLAIRELTTEPGEPAPAVGPPAAVPRGQQAGDFERRLTHWDVDLTGDDPGLAEAMAIASSLRRAAPSQIVAPDRRFVLRLRDALASEHPEASGGGALPARLRRALASLRVEIVRRPRPFAATAVAAAAILAILTVQAFGSPRAPACGGRPCPATTTAPVAAPASATAAPLTSIREATTSTSLPSTTAAAPVSTAPPATGPPSTAPVTTRPPRTTTSRQTTTTATTTSTTTTTVATTTTAP